ncbi:MAG TPA: flagellar motor protein MotB [Syntrophales bacterium]|nr:flagellar motor protein MotB [Syntrophales bacterium]HOX93471.1 flagellar motor protein MotB [Syntrophales bacterium]HPI57560.1 flagellar motor protein MotB [Syntrophales bacterium]HPN24717.1 flagellar motor protein MotB [Syntrophales bacterium]HQM29847.1 flagellar motor protein MotB [Syntrophales bacterium]
MKNSESSAAEQMPEPVPRIKAVRSRRFQGSSSQADTGNEIWLLTLTDMFMLLMICFVLLFGMSLYRQKEAAVAAAPPVAAVPVPSTQEPPAIQAASALESDLLAMLDDRRDVTVERRSTYIVLTFPERILFDSGQAEVKPTAQPLLGKVAAIIMDRPGLVVAVHGHTDDRPIHNRRYPSNWELSVDRSTQVAGALVQMGIQPDRLSIKGHGEDHPLYPNDSDDNRMKNRRVEIQFFLTPPDA